MAKMKYRVTYERKSTSSYWTYSSEIIEVKGIVHAHTLAKDHLKSLQKLTELPLRIGKIMLIGADG